MLQKVSKWKEMHELHRTHRKHGEPIIKTFIPYSFHMLRNDEHESLLLSNIGKVNSLGLEDSELFNNQCIRFVEFNLVNFFLFIYLISMSM